MNAHFTEALFGITEIIWLMFIALLVLLTLPFWVIPYTGYKCLKSFRARGEE